MSKAICSRCRQPHDGNGSRCDKCSGLAKQDNHKQTKKRDKVYNTPRWKVQRKRKLRRNPLCEICLSNNKTVPAKMVDHVKEIRDGGAAYDIDNLQSLCWKCHGSKTARAAKNRARISRVAG